MITEFRKYAEEQGFYVPKMEDLDRLVDAMTSAYGAHYPLFQWMDQGGDGTGLKEINPNPKGWQAARRAGLMPMFSQYIIIADSPEIKAWILIQPPHLQTVSRWEWFVDGGFKAIWHMGLGPIQRMNLYEHFADQQRAKYGPNAVYFNNLVVRQDCQHQGLGKKLMKLCHDYIDLNGYQSYLETHTEANVACYKHRGYKLMAEAPLPGTRLVHYVMLRA